MKHSDHNGFRRDVHINALATKSGECTDSSDKKKMRLNSRIPFAASAAGFTGRLHDAWLVIRA